ncbi:HET-domain-containing protein [Trametes versicolor FP-101664 SS1]|uniref:HET-domain-containing protein n=1 Tax=Trametes versicolor (strain FP-101664) TaxID=717944 RepID=UPI0004624628|nr:HET-domain-containing protein [Trametes versicolor FP-101664 SS1]EIW52255.1 HET-domain-containing protein [Trametes versicolor FP-101664 SS1]
MTSSIPQALSLPPKPPSVCETCWKGPLAAQLGLLTTPVTLNEERIVGGYSYSISGLELEHGSASGCALCTFLLAHGVPSRDARRQLVDQVKITLGSSGVPFCVPAKAQELNVVVNDEMSVFEGLVHTSSDDPAAPYIVARDPVLNVGSPRSLSLAKALVNECVHGHERCIYISPPSDVRLPTRLVDCIDPARPRLASTGGEYGKYLALSYVWGEPQQHQTTVSNISAYADGIDAAFLPRTIHDAIHVTHSLGFRYLWVDSLCIVQDSDEDKLHELGRMHFIYRYAYLTIIAASAERVSAGFLQDRPAKDSTTLPFMCLPRPLAPGDSNTDVRQVGEVHVTARALSGAVAVYKNFDGMDPVHTRGWCLQELYLSPRALIFTSRTLRLRCQAATQNVGGSLYNMQNDVGLPDALFHPAPPPVAYGSAEWVDLHTRWWSIVDGYTRRALGHPSDKLVACGALAEAFHRVLRTDYLAGLWRDTLVRDLVWSRAIRGTDRPAVYRAPSWSWAAVDGEIIIHRIHHDAEAVAVAEVVRCTVTLKDTGLMFGEVTGGSLVLRAALMPCKVRTADDFDGGYLLLSPRRKQDSDVPPGFIDDAVREDTRKVRGRCLTDYIVDLQDESEPKWLVPLLRRDGRFPLVWGLMVALETPGSASETGLGKVYRRIGAFHADCSWDVLQDDRDSDGELVDIELV